MNALWQEFLGAAGARFDNGVLADFGDASGELHAARDATVLAPLSHLGLIECAGEDAKDFLHNQVTSDINHLASDAAQHSAWCSAKGRMLASFLVSRNGPAYRLRLSADLVPAILKRLQMFVLRSKVSVADASATHALLGLSGPQAEAALRAAALPVPLQALEAAAFTAGQVIRLDDARFEIIVANEAAGELWRQLVAHARPVATPAWRWLDIQAGIPLITEATREEFVPQMANFEQIGGVSFHKGCYPGQEIVARTQYLGKVKRHLYRTRTAEAPLAGMPIFSPETPEHACGMVVNAAPAPDGGYVALAVIQEGAAATGDLQLGTPGGSHVDAQALASPPASPPVPPLTS